MSQAQSQRGRKVVAKKKNPLVPFYWGVGALVILGAAFLITYAARGGFGGGAVSAPNAATGRTDEGFYYKGNPDAAVTVIEYGDYQCPTCGFYFKNLGPIISSLHRLESQLDRSVRSLGGQIEQVDEEVRDVKAVQAQTKDRLDVLYEKFLEFVGRSERIAAAQRAETRIVRINDEIEHTYGHHKVVRRSATGILQAFDTGLVQEETVRQVSEELMIQTPRYWLAPALVGLAAWAGDDEALCARAVEEAFRRSTSKTSKGSGGRVSMSTVARTPVLTILPSRLK